MAKFWEFEPTEQYQRRKAERAAPQSQGIGTQPTPSATFDPIRALRTRQPFGVEAQPMPADEEETTPTGGLPDWAKPIASQMTRSNAFGPRRTPEPTAAAPTALPEWAQPIMDKLRPALQPITNAPKVALGAAGLGADMLTGQVDPIAWTRSLAQRAGVGESGPFTPGQMLDLTGAGSQMALDRYRGSPTEELVNKVAQGSRQEYAAPLFGQYIQNNLGYRLAAPLLGLPEPEEPFDPLSLLPGGVGPLMSPWGSPAQVLRDVATGKSPEESRLTAKEFEQQLPGLLRMAGETTMDPFGLPANIAVGLVTKGANLPAWASGLLTAYQVADKFDLAANYASMEPEQLVVAGALSLGMRVGLPALMRAVGGKQAKLQYAPAEMDETLARHLRQETEAYRRTAGLPIEDEITIRSAKDVREGPAVGALSGLNLGQEAVNETKMPADVFYAEAGRKLGQALRSGQKVELGETAARAARGAGAEMQRNRTPLPTYKVIDPNDTSPVGAWMRDTWGKMTGAVQQQGQRLATSETGAVTVPQSVGAVGRDPAAADIIANLRQRGAIMPVYGRDYPVGKAQQTVLDALGIKVDSFREASQILDELGLVVTAKRQGRATVPSVQVQPREGAVIGASGEGEAGRGYPAFDTAPIQQWVEQPTIVPATATVRPSEEPGNAPPPEFMAQQRARAEQSLKPLIDDMRAFKAQGGTLDEWAQAREGDIPRLAPDYAPTAPGDTYRNPQVWNDAAIRNDIERLGYKDVRDLYDRLDVTPRPAPATPAGVEAAPAGKQPWEMTLAEIERIGYIGYDVQTGKHIVVPFQSGRVRGLNDVSIAGEHQRAILSALSRGEPVPTEVLADYPDLAQTAITRPSTEDTARVDEPVVGSQPPAVTEPPAEPIRAEAHNTAANVHAVAEDDAVTVGHNVTRDGEAVLKPDATIARDEWSSNQAAQVALLKERLPKAAKGKLDAYRASVDTAMKRLDAAMQRRIATGREAVGAAQDDLAAAGDSQQFAIEQRRTDLEEAKLRLRLNKPQGASPAEYARPVKPEPVAEPAPQQEATVKMMLTNADKRALADLGYTPADVRQMTPQEGARVIGGNIAKGSELPAVVERPVETAGGGRVPPREPPQEPPSIPPLGEDDKLPSQLGLVRRAQQEEQIERSLGERVRKMMHDAEAMFLDRYASLKGLDKATGMDTYVDATLVSGARSRAKSLLLQYAAPIFRRVENNLDDWKDMLVIARMEDLQARWPNTKLPAGVTRPDIARDELRAKVGDETYAELEQAADEFWALNKKLFLDDAVDAGTLSADGAQKMLDTNPHYVPFFRQGFEDGLSQWQQASARAVGNMPASFSKAMEEEGSVRNLKDPLASWMASVVQHQVQNARNRTSIKIVDALRALDPDLVKEGAHAEAGWGVVKHRVDGELTEFTVPVEYERVMKGLDEESAGIVVNILQAMSRPMRTGATLYNPTFLLRNVMRDANTAYWTEGLIPFSKDWFAGMRSAMTKDGSWHSAAQAGGFTGGVLDYMTKPQSLTRAQAVGGGIPLKTAKDWALSLPRLLRVLNEVAEEGTRMGVWHKLEREGVLPKDAAYRMANSTVNFSKAGYATQAINRVVPFLNARLQGTLNVVDAVVRTKKGRKAFLARAAIMAMPALILYLHNRRFDTFDLVPDYEWRNNWVVMIGEGQENPDPRYPNQEGRRYPIYLKLPKGEIASFVSAAPEALLRAANNAGDHSAAELVLRALYEAGVEMSPIEPDASTFATPFIGTAMQIGANRDLFRDRDIVPQGELSRPAEYQFDEQTSRIAVALGAKTGVSPRYIDFAIRDVTAGAGSTGLFFADLALGSLGYNPQVPGAAARRELTVLEKLAKAPVTSGLVGVRRTELDRQSYARMDKAVEAARKDLYKNAEVRRFGIGINPPGDTVTIDGVPTPLTPDQRMRILETSTPLMRAALDDLITRDYYKQATDMEKRKLLDTVRGKVQDHARELVLAEMRGEEPEVPWSAENMGKLVDAVAQYREYRAIAKYKDWTPAQEGNADLALKKIAELRKANPRWNRERAIAELRKTNPEGARLAMQAYRMRNTEARQAYWAAHPYLDVFYGDMSIDEVA